jgi:hypothetical protein
MKETFGKHCSRRVRDRAGPEVAARSCSRVPAAMMPDRSFGRLRGIR